MADVVIENPILNSPFEEPKRHFKFAEDGITDEIVEERRISSYFVPIPPPKKRGRQLTFDTEWTQNRIQENTFINQVRGRVSIWRRGGYQGVTKTTRRLLEYWRNPERDKKLFFCQIEALETAIYITEVAGKYGDAWIENHLRQANSEANPDLYRIAFKMATGSGKTVVMAMIIAWHTLNKMANPQDARFTDSFLVVAPGITIRDRLHVLLPNAPDNYYHERDVVPPEDKQRLGKAKVVITNFHAFLLRERFEGARLTKALATVGEEAVKAKLGIKVVYDLSATPFFLRGSGYPEGTLFPWVVSDFSLIDAIESGIVKVPRVPISDDQVRQDLPTYRNLWMSIREALPKKGRGTEAVQGEPKLPAELQGALHSLYGNYEKYYRQWESHRQGTPPVFIIVCSNTNVSKLVYDYVAGWNKPLDGSSIVVPGALPVFNNEENGRW
jgi:type III restriction enzyme